MQPRNRKQIERALSNAFPSRKSLEDFSNGDHETVGRAISKIISYAYSHKIIKEASLSAFVDFIESGKNGNNFCPPDNYTFGNLLDDLKVTSQKSLSNQLNEICRRLEMPPVDAPMLTRFRKNQSLSDSRKRLILRALAFWIGMRRPNMQWDYENLLVLMDSREMKTDHIQEGIMLTAEVQGRSGTVDNSSLLWVKSELKKVINDLKLYHLQKPDSIISNRSITSTCLNIPRSHSADDDIRTYAVAIQDALAIAHQLAGRWALTEYSGHEKHLVICIAAGSFKNSDYVTDTVLSANLSGDPAIRLTDRAYICAKFADAKTGFFPAQEVTTFMGNTLKVWPVSHFWHNYFDFIPSLLTRKMLPATKADFNAFRASVNTMSSNDNSKFRALSAIFTFPINTFIAIEVIKVCMAKKMFHEANALITVVLIADPHHQVARTLRMQAFLNIAVASPEPGPAEHYFRRAEGEGALLTKQASDESQVWAELGNVYLAKGMKYLSMNRKKIRSYRSSQILLNFRKAKRCFKKGMAVSPKGYDSKCSIFIIYIYALSRILESEADVFSVGFKNDRQGIFREISTNAFAARGLLADGNSGKLSSESAARLGEHLLTAFEEYKGGIKARNYIPNVLLTLSCVMWDFMPRLSVRMYRTVIACLHQARDMAIDLLDEDISIYACAKMFGEFVSPEHFIGCVENTLSMIEFDIDLNNADDTDFIDTLITDKEDIEKLSGLKISLMNIDNAEMDATPLVMAR